MADGPAGNPSIINFPKLFDWLTSLDTNPIHGVNNQNYSQYAVIFKDKGSFVLMTLWV
jgi:hypothetical protein